MRSTLNCILRGLVIGAAGADGRRTDGRQTSATCGQAHTKRRDKEIGRAREVGMKEVRETSG